jgi:hypothetical protein
VHALGDYPVVLCGFQEALEGVPAKLQLCCGDFCEGQDREEAVP